MRFDARWMVALALLVVTSSACFPPPPPPWRGREFRDERAERHDGRWEYRGDRHERWRDDRRERWD